MSTPAVEVRPRGRALQGRPARAVANFAIAAGLVALAWSVVVWRWNDPVSSLYTRWEQHQLAGQLELQRSGPTPDTDDPADLARAAAAFRERTRPGDPIGWIALPRIGLHLIAVNGTDTASLRKGPGRYLGSFMPGEGRLVYIAGHRTTYLAPFARIDELRPGDRITLTMPYAKFVYSVTGARVVTEDNLSVLEPGHTERLVLQACHPRFFATHRYLVYARPIKIEPRG